MKEMATIFVVAVVMGVSLCSAQAGIITLSTMSSDETDPSVLDAEILFEVVDSALTIKVTNTTTGAHPYDITEIYFNATENVTGLMLTSPASGWAIYTWSNETKADGFGTFDYLIKTIQATDGGIEHGDPPTSFELTIAGTSPWSQSDFDTEFSVPPPSEKLAIVAMKFVRGPCGDSAFGASVPEPATICLLGVGALSLIRRKQSV